MQSYTDAIKTNLKTAYEDIIITDCVRFVTTVSGVLAAFRMLGSGGRSCILLQVGKKCRLVDNIGARLGSEANFGSHKTKISN